MSDDFILSDVELTMSLNDTKETVLSQMSDLYFLNPIRKSALKVFETKCNLAIDFPNEDNIDFVEDVTRLKELVFSNVRNKFINDFGIIIESNDAYVPDEYIQTLYNVFIVDIHMYMARFITLWIINHQTELIEKYCNGDITNMTIKAARKQYATKQDAVIAASTIDLVYKFFENEHQLINPETFISILFSVDPDDYEMSTLYNLFNANVLIFDIPKYRNFILHIYRNSMVAPENVSNLALHVLELTLKELKPRQIQEGV